MTWLQQAGAVLALILLGVAWTAVLEPVARFLFSPPRGAWALTLIWLGAPPAILGGISLRSTHPALGAGLVILAIPVALLATLIYRDERRRSLGLTPVTTPVPYTIGVVGRAGFTAAALLAVLLAALFAVSEPHDWWNAFCLAVAAIGFIRIAWHGRLPQGLRRNLGAEE